MVAPPGQTRRALDPFSQVKALVPHGEDAAKKLRVAYDLLVSHGAHQDAERLSATDKAAERRDFPALERLVVTDHSLAELSEIQHGQVRMVVGWRNAAALVPLLVTWLFLGWASFSYHHQLQRHPELSTQPFLVLWQERFGGRFIPTFAETALTAFVLLIVVLALTVWAHQVESRADKVFADVTTKVDDAVNALALAVQSSTVRPPESAQEWAEAAQRVLTETQDMIATAASETKKLAEENNRIAQTAKDAVAELHAQGRELIAKLTAEVQETMVSVRSDNAQFIARTTEEATTVLQQAADANQKLVEQQMTPLFEGFRASLGDYRADQEVYRRSADAMARGVTELTKSAAILAGSSQSYTEVASSIDEHLRLIQSSQSDFVSRVAENSASMGTAATTMRDVSGLMAGSMKEDLERLARDVVNAGTQLAAVDRSLASAAVAIHATTVALEAAARNMAATTAAPVAGVPAPRRRLLDWRR